MFSSISAIIISSITINTIRKSFVELPITMVSYSVGAGGSLHTSLLCFSPDLLMFLYFFSPIFEKSLRRVEIILSRCHQQQRQVRLRGALNAQQAGKIKTLKAIYFDQISERKKLASSKSICLLCKLYFSQS